jgi:hypothetical protein
VRFPRSLLRLLQQQSRSSSGAVADTAPPPPTGARALASDQTGSAGRNWEYADSLTAIESYVRSWAGSSEFIALWSEWRTRTDEGPEEAGGGHSVRRPIGPKTGPLGGRVTPETQVLTVVRLWRLCIAESLLHGPCRIGDGLRRHDAVGYALARAGLRRHAPVSAVLPWDLRATEGRRQCPRDWSGAERALPRIGGDARPPSGLPTAAGTTTAASMEDAGGDPSARDAKPMATERPWLRLLPREHLHLPARSDNGEGSPSSTADPCRSGSEPVVLWDEKANPQEELSQGVDDASQRAA